MPQNPIETPPIPAALASNACDSSTNCPTVPPIAAIPTPDEGSLSASSKDLSLIGGAAAQPGLEPAASGAAFMNDHGAGKKGQRALAAPKAGGQTAASFKIQLLIKASDIGFEALYLELAAAGSTSHRTRHVKRVLHQIVAGQHSPGVSALGSNASPAAYAGRMPSFKMEFRLSERDVGLEKLFLEICMIEGTVQRSHYVKRRLFNAYCLSAQPSGDAAPCRALPVPAAREPALQTAPDANPAVPIASLPDPSSMSEPHPAAKQTLAQRMRKTVTESEK